MPRLGVTYTGETWSLITHALAFSDEERTVLIGESAVAICSYLFAIATFWSGLWVYKIGSMKALGVLVIAVSLFINFVFFSQYVFPSTSQSLGGGRPAIVHIEFTDSVPDEARSDFDISRAAGYPRPWYYARLIYLDGHSVFLLPANWFSRQVFEFRRDQLQMLKYTEINPVDFGMRNSLLTEPFKKRSP